MLATVLAMAMFAFIGAVSPGPVNIIATSTSARYGLRASLPHVLGASLAYGLIVLIAGILLTQLIALSALFVTWLRYAGTAFLLYLAYSIARAEADAPEQQSGKVPSLWQGVLSQSLNPKAWLVSMSGVGLYVTSGDQVGLRLAIFVGLSFVICLFGVGSWALIGHWLTQFLATPQHQCYFNRTMGLLLALSIITMYLP